MGSNYLRNVEDDELENKYKPLQMRYREGVEYLSELRKRAPNGVSLISKGDYIVVTSPEYLGISEYKISLEKQNHFLWFIENDSSVLQVISNLTPKDYGRFSEDHEDYDKVRVTDESFMLLTEHLANCFWDTYYEKNKKLIKEERNG